MLNLFDRHFSILRFLREFREENGYSPSFQEISEAIEVDSKSQISFYLNGLELAGLITRNHRISRSIVLTKSGMDESRKEHDPKTVVRICLFSGKGN